MNLSRRQQKALPAVLTAGSIAEAAKLSGVPERTLNRWTAECPAFREALLAAEGQIVSAVARRLAQLADKACRTLEEVMDNKKAPASARVRAADVALNRVLEFEQLRGLHERIDLVETRHAIHRTD